jgi:dihydroorotate dehydrogenase (NAD+) catalytic subunit
VTPDEVDLSCEVGDLRMPNPVMTASGCGGGRELAPFLEVADLGAFVTGSVTLDPCAGAGGPRLVETPSGVLHRTGLQNPGLQGFLTGELPWLAQRGARTVASIAAGSLGEYAELARRVGNSPGVRAVEVNLDLAGREAPDRRLGEDHYQAGKVVAVVRRELPRGIPVLAKLAGQPGLVDLAGAVVKEGADAVVVSGQVPGAAIDRSTLAPSVSSGTLSGPAVHAVAVHAVWQVHAAMPDVPIVGVGGVRTGWDALELLLAGARAVQVGTAALHDPGAAARVVEELRVELGALGIESVARAVGAAHGQGVSR